MKGKWFVLQSFLLVVSRFAFCPTLGQLEDVLGRLLHSKVEQVKPENLTLTTPPTISSIDFRIDSMRASYDFSSSSNLDRCLSLSCSCIVASRALLSAVFSPELSLTARLSWFCSSSIRDSSRLLTFDGLEELRDKVLVSRSTILRFSSLICLSRLACGRRNVSGTSIQIGVN